jgi:hypothetical protein
MAPIYSDKSRRLSTDQSSRGDRDRDDLYLTRKLVIGVRVVYVIVGAKHVREYAVAFVCLKVN